MSKPLLRFYKQNHRIFGLDEQLCIALVDSIRERRVRACVLLLWAGADPARRVSSELRHSFPGYADPAHKDYDFERHCLISAFEQLGLEGDLQFFQQLNLTVPPDQLPNMLRFAYALYKGRLFEHLLDQIPDDQLNTGERNSCKPLEDLVAHQFWSLSEFSKPNTLPILGAIEKLLKRGAKWNPSEDDVRRIREALKTAPSTHVGDVVGLLHRYNQSPRLLWTVIRTPGMQKVFRYQDLKLWKAVGEK